MGHNRLFLPSVSRASSHRRSRPPSSCRPCRAAVPRRCRASTLTWLSRVQQSCGEPRAVLPVMVEAHLCSVAHSSTHWSLYSSCTDQSRAASASAPGSRGDGTFQPAPQHARLLRLCSVSFSCCSASFCCCSSSIVRFCAATSSRSVATSCCAASSARRSSGSRASNGPRPLGVARVDMCPKKGFRHGATPTPGQTHQHITCITGVTCRWLAASLPLLLLLLRCTACCDSIACWKKHTD
jgi:hypothetical protein